VIRAALSLLLAGCASPEVVCDMRVDYERMSAVAQSGSVRLDWQFVRQVKPGTYGSAWCNGDHCLLTLQMEPPNFSEVCQLARLGHEVLHVMKAAHER
jgi:hypothetical protein